MVYSFWVVSYADTDIDIKASLVLSTSDLQSAGSVAASVSKFSKKYNGILVEASNGRDWILQFDSKKYNELSGDEKRKFMEKALTAVSECGAGPQAKNKVYNFIASQDSAVTNSMKYLQSDANADFVKAKKYFDPWSSIVGTIIGFLCIMIFMCSAFSVLFDMGYIVLPGVRLLLERGDETSKPFGVSREAYTAVQDGEKSTEYKNVLAIYLKRRIGLIFAMGICISYIISGKIYEVIIFFIDAF